MLFQLTCHLRTNLRLFIGEMLRYLTERLPAMITPRWVRTRTQPIAIRDVRDYVPGPDMGTDETCMAWLQS